MKLEEILDRLAGNIIFVTKKVEKVLNLKRLTIYDRVDFTKKYNKMVLCSNLTLEIINNKNTLELEYLRYEIKNIQKTIKEINIECTIILSKVDR
jgi:hypothetical protein